MTENITNKEIFVLEASKSAAIDTACTKTVVGEQWFVNYKSNLTENTIKNIFFPSDTKFKFGDGKQASAIKRVIFPACIAGKICKIEAEIVKENIPLLLSKSSLKPCGTIIDMNNDKAIIFNKEIDLHFSSSGHFCVTIVP